MHGTVWENLVKAPLKLEWISSTSWRLIKNTVNQSSAARSVEDTGTKWETSPAQIHPLSDISWCLPVRAPPSSSPLLSTGARKSRAQTSKESRLVQHPCQPENHSHLTSEWETLSEDWFFLQEEKNQPHILYITLYVIVYNLLIPWWWCPCMEYLVFGFLKTAWNKMYNSQSYLCFCNCRDKSTLLFHPLTCNWFDVYFLTKHGFLSSFNMSMPRFSVTNSTLSYRLCYWFSSYSLRAIKWR